MTARRASGARQFIAKEVQGWLEAVGVKTIYIDPGSPWQNGHVESFHNRLRDEGVKQELFPSMPEARVVIEDWRRSYHRIHPHSSLGFQSPDECATNHERSALICAPATPALRSMPA